jgi:hypothetical protein
MTKQQQYIIILHAIGLSVIVMLFLKSSNFGFLNLRHLAWKRGPVAQWFI